MRLLLDINVLLDLAFQRAGASASATVIASCGRRNEGWLAWHTLATLFYVVERQGSTAVARSFVGDLLTWAEVAPTARSDALEALSWPMPDYEDALQDRRRQLISHQKQIPSRR